MKKLAFLVILFSYQLMAQGLPARNPTPNIGVRTESNGVIIINSTGSNGFWGNNDYFEAKNKQRKARCLEFFKQNYTLKEADQISNYCATESVLAATNDEEYSFTSADYIQCLNTNKMLAIPEDRFVVDCSVRYKISAMKRKEFPECISQLMPEFGKLPAYDACQDGTFLTDLQGEDFKICAQNMKYLKQTPEKTLSKCSNYSERNRIVSKRFVDCLNIMKPANLGPNVVFEFCSKDQNLSALTSYSFPACVKAIASVGVKNELNQISVCSNSDAQDIVVKNPKCYLESLTSTYRNYFPYVALTSTNFYGDKNLFSFLNRDCKGESKGFSQNIAPSPYLTFVKEFNIHTYETMAWSVGAKEHAQVGGLSALSYDAKTEELFLLSDETYTVTKLPPRMYVYSLSKDLELKDKMVFPFTFNLAKDEFEPDVDPEGLVHLSTGEFMVSSEIGANEVQKLAKGKLQITNISIFDAKGSYISSLPLPESYKSKFIKTESSSFWSSTPIHNDPNPRGRAAKNLNIGLDGSSAVGSGLNPPPPPPPPIQNQDPIVSYQRITGLEYNKSLESLSISPDEKTLFTGNESALIQDQQLKGRCKGTGHNSGNSAAGTNTNTVKTNDSFFGSNDSGSGFFSPAPTCGKVIRIVTYGKNEGNSLQFKFQHEYKYELEPEVDNGLSEILALNSRQILTLERSWDSVKQKVTARIFKIELRDESMIPPDAKSAQIDTLPALEKKLIIDFDSVLPKLSPGFRNIDNLEGMGFGPILPSGKRSLLLVTDNNYSLKQRTVLLIFEIQPALFDNKE